MQVKDTVDNVSATYLGDSGKVYHQKHVVPVEAHDWIAQSRAEKFAPYISPMDVVLEYGVGLGWNLDALVCKERLGYDLSVFLEKALSEKGIKFIADTKKMEDASIDKIICHHVLEHTPEPVQILCEIRRLLRPEGKLLLVVPYEREKRYRHFNIQDRDHHLFSWNVQTLGNLVTAAGYRVEQAGIGCYGWDRFISVWASRLKIGASGFNALKKLSMAIIPLKEVRIVAQASK